MEGETAPPSQVENSFDTCAAAAEFRTNRKQQNLNIWSLIFDASDSQLIHFSYQHHTELTHWKKYLINRSPSQVSSSEGWCCRPDSVYVCVYSQKCKDVKAEAPQQTQQDASSLPSNASPLSGIPVLTLLVFSALHLITCEYWWHCSHDCTSDVTPQNCCCTWTHHLCFINSSD